MPSFVFLRPQIGRDENPNNKALLPPSRLERDPFGPGTSNHMMNASCLGVLQQPLTSTLLKRHRGTNGRRM